ncbi:MAG: CYTH domain-containing protein [Spirochaetales bacterium]|nr:CYTH domain-containing protein [Spirochaetales bacterium]
MANQNFQEIERKFLVKDLPSHYEDYPSVPISQTYLSQPGVAPTLRARQYGDKYLLTIKKRTNPNRIFAREVEIGLTKEEYLAVKAMGEGRELKKRRYFIPWKQWTVELDIFEGNLEGLILAEIEFASEEEALSAPLPSWFGEDVTADLNYSNNSLSQKGRPCNEERKS